MCRRTMKKSKSILSLLLTVILIVGLGFTVITGIGKSKTGAMKNIKLGLQESCSFYLYYLLLLQVLSH